MLQTIGLAAGTGFGFQLGSFGGGGLVVGAGGFTVGLIGTIGFSVSLAGIGGHIRFSNFTTLPGRSSAGLKSSFGLEALSSSHILTRLEIEPELFRFSSPDSGSSRSGSGSREPLVGSSQTLLGLKIYNLQ